MDHMRHDNKRVDPWLTRYHDAVLGGMFALSLVILFVVGLAGWLE